MTDTTNISDLPPKNNITLETNEVVKKSLPQKQEMTPSMVNKIVTGIQTASASHMTQLPSRDIPMMTEAHVKDEQSRPNYIPPPQEDYIQKHDSIQSMIENNRKKEVKQERLETIYDEIQTPVFVMILYLLFQLPVFQKMLRKHTPSLFGADGHSTFSGYIFKTFLFGISFYLIQKGTHYLSRM